MRRWAIRAAACFALSAGGAQIAAAQEIEPNEFVPAPDGTNLQIGYYLYAHNTDLNIAGGPTVKGSGLEVNVGIERLVHYDYIGGMPAGIQILEAFGSESGGHVGDTRLGSAFGASNPILSAFFWPVADTQKKQYFIIAGFIYPPVGTYDKNSPLNLGGAFGTLAPSWAGDVQFGWDQGIGEHFSYDASLDIRQSGSITVPGGNRITPNTDFRLQTWLNWNWTRSFQTSIGWESNFGGDQYENGTFNGTKIEYERLRAATSYFILPNTQLLLEVNHDFVAVGGFKQEIGAIGRVVFIF